MKVNLHEASKHFSHLVEAAQGGEEVVICRDGAPVARLTAWEPQERPIGIWAGQGWIAEDFTSFPDELGRVFYGDPD